MPDNVQSADNHSSAKEAAPKLTRVEINGQILEYEEKNIPEYPLEYDDARALFCKTKELLDKAGIKFALGYGSLLGAVRGDGIIKTDTDMDIFTWEEEKLRGNLISFQKAGLKIWRITPGWGYSFITDESKAHIDVFILKELTGWKTLPWRLHCISLGGWITPRKYFREWGEVEFLGEKVRCPANPEKILEFWYGSDWRIPQNKKGMYRAKSRYYAENLLYSVKFLFNRDFRQKAIQRKKEKGYFFAH